MIKPIISLEILQRHSSELGSVVYWDHVFLGKIGMRSTTMQRIQKLTSEGRVPSLARTSSYGMSVPS